MAADHLPLNKIALAAGGLKARTVGLRNYPPQCLSRRSEMPFILHILQAIAELETACAPNAHGPLLGEGPSISSSTRQPESAMIRWTIHDPKERPVTATTFWIPIDLLESFMVDVFRGDSAAFARHARRARPALRVSLRTLVSQTFGRTGLTGRAPPAKSDWSK